MVVNKFNCIEESLCEIRDNLRWFKPNDKHRSLKPTKLYAGSILKLWNEFKRIIDAKRKLDNVSWSKMYLKVKSEIKDLRKGSIGVSTLENFYKRKMNPKPKTLKVIVSWIENERREYDEENYKINS